MTVTSTFMKLALITLLVFLAVAYCHPLHDEVVFGSIHMDKAVLTKLVDGTRPVLIKIDKEHAHGEKKEEWMKLVAFVNAAGVENRMLLGNVGVQTQDDMDPIEEMESREGRKKKQRNVDLAMEYQIMPKDCPTYFVWPEGSVFADEPIKYTGLIKADHIIDWLRKSGVYVPEQGCFEEVCLEVSYLTHGQFDRMAREFVLKDKDGQKAVLEKAETRASEFEGRRKVTGAIYVSIMKKLIEQGDDYEKTEVKRIKRVLNGKLSDTKRELLLCKLGVLKTFYPPPAPTPVSTPKDKEEL